MSEYKKSALTQVCSTLGKLPAIQWQDMGSISNTGELKSNI